MAPQKKTTGQAFNSKKILSKHLDVYLLHLRYDLRSLCFMEQTLVVGY